MSEFDRWQKMGILPQKIRANGKQNFHNEGQPCNRVLKFKLKQCDSRARRGAQFGT